MTLTVVVGSSGSGKTTFLGDVHKNHQCTYIRQYHNLRPYIAVNLIPNFDQTQLPFWSIYAKENPDIKIGGTMAGEFTPGFSGGQRKLLLFELIYQRTLKSTDLLICLDEPFAGVTDDFVPFIVDRLKEMAKTHNLLLVTNDHVKTLTEMADNIITVSAIDRANVKINDVEKNDRALVISAVSSGKTYEHTANNEDLNFFIDVEIKTSAALFGIAAFALVSFGLFLLTYWDTAEGSEGLTMVAIQIVAYFCINPYLLALVDWRNFMTEEAEALMHSSVKTNKILKTLLTTFLLLLISLGSYGILNAVTESRFSEVRFLIGMVFDSFSLTVCFMFFGIFTTLPFEAVQILASMPFLFMIFFSTTFSPGAGVAGVKLLRYLFPRFYLFCMLPGIQDSMEGCPNEDMTLFWLVATGLLGVIVFLAIKGIGSMRKANATAKVNDEQAKIQKSPEFIKLQAELFDERKRVEKVVSLKDVHCEAEGDKKVVGTPSKRSIMTFFKGGNEENV